MPTKTESRIDAKMSSSCRNCRYQSSVYPLIGQAFTLVALNE